MSSPKYAATKDARKPQNAGKKSQTKPGRPPEAVPQDIADEIIEWISQGKTLRDYCRQDGKPHWNTVALWRHKDPEFDVRFTRAREAGADAIAEECLRIADDGINDTYIDDDGKERIDMDVLQRSRLRVETRLKLLAKWFPQRYGDKQTVQHEGGVVLNVVTGVSDDD